MMAHESDGAIIAKKIALIVSCKSCGHEYKRVLGVNQACPHCKAKSERGQIQNYDTVKEIYE